MAAVVTRSFIVRLVALCSLIAFADGVDMQLIAYTAPFIADDLGVGRTGLGRIFSAGLLGTMIGAASFGQLGDRIGRRPAIVVAMVLFCLTTALTGLAQTTAQLLAIRFLTGVAAGGAMPLVWTLLTDYAPAHRRSFCITLTMTAYALGSAIVGPAAVWLAEAQGWRDAFFAAAALSAAATVMVALWLPESIRFLVRREGKAERLRAVARRIAPDFDLPGEILTDIAGTGGAAPRTKPPALGKLFHGPLRWITPLLWTAYGASAATLYLRASWTPIILETASFSRAESATIASLTTVLAGLLGLVIARSMDRRGVRMLMWIYILSVPLLAILATTGPTAAPFVVLFVSGSMLQGAGHQAMPSVPSSLYETALRARGNGWANAMSKIGAIVGPLAGGALLAHGAGAQGAFRFQLACGAVAAISLLGVLLATQRMGKAGTSVP